MSRGRKTENRRQKTEQSKSGVGNATSVASKQSKSGAIRIVCVFFVSYRLFRGGRAECASTREFGGPPLRPHPKKFIKIGLRPIAWTAIFATYTLRIGVPLDLLVGVEKAEQEWRW